MLVLTCLAALGGLMLLAWGGIAYAQAAGRVETMLRVQALDIADDHKAAALAYFDRVSGQISLWRTLWDHIRAPFVLFLPLLRLPREADDLPDSLAYWRNNVSINGDGWGWFNNETGQWVQCSAEKEPPGVTAVRYGDPAYGGDAYYAPGHHPRSWYARWVWLALRNVASARMLEAGPLLTERPILLAGVPDPARFGGFLLLWNGKTGPDAAYYWHSATHSGPLMLWTQVGAKLGTPYTYPELLPCRAMLTCTWRAFRGG